MRGVPTVMRIFVIGVLLVSLESALWADWPQWRGPARDGVAVGVHGAGDVARAADEEVAGHRRSRSRVAGHRRQRASSCTRGSGNREVVTAFDLASGKQLWQDGVDAPYIMNPAAIGHGPGPKSTPLDRRRPRVHFGHHAEFSRRTTWQPASCCGGKRRRRRRRNSAPRPRRSPTARTSSRSSAGWTPAR